MAGALQGNVQAGAAMGALEQNASLARLAAALKDRQSQVTGYRARYGSLFDDALNSLYQRAMQQTTMRDNSRLAWAQFGEQQQQNDVNNAQQDAAAAAQNALDWAQLSAQEQDAMSRDDEAGRKARQKRLKQARHKFFKERNATTEGSSTSRFTFKVTTVDDDGQYHTTTVRTEGANLDEAKRKLYEQYPQYTGRAGAHVEVAGSKVINSTKVRANQDKDLAAKYRKILLKWGYQPAAVNQILNNWLRRQWGTSY